MPLKEELTTAMHSEFKVGKRIDILLRVGNVWKVLDSNASRKEIEERASSYGVTYEQCMELKGYWERVKMKKYEGNQS